MFSLINSDVSVVPDGTADDDDAWSGFSVVDEGETHEDMMDGYEEQRQQLLKRLVLEQPRVCLTIGCNFNSHGKPALVRRHMLGRKEPSRNKTFKSKCGLFDGEYAVPMYEAMAKKLAKAVVPAPDAGTTLVSVTAFDQVSAAAAVAQVPACEQLLKHAERLAATLHGIVKDLHDLNVSYVFDLKQHVPVAEESE